MISQQKCKRISSPQGRLLVDSSSPFLTLVQNKRVDYHSTHVQQVQGDDATRRASFAHSQQDVEHAEQRDTVSQHLQEGIRQRKCL